MIVTLANEIVNRLERLYRLENIEEEKRNIENTRLRLADLKKELLQIRKLHQLLGERLAPNIVESVLKETDRQAEQLKASHQLFSSQNQYDQFGEVDKIRGALKRQREYLEQNWGSIVDNALKPHKARLKLIRYLPEVKAHEAQIKQLIANIEQWRDNPPQNQQALTFFDQTMNRISEYLSEIEGLPWLIKIFLEKLDKQQATVEDLTPEVLAWCQARGRSKAFRLSFID